MFVVQLFIYGFHELTEANIFPYSEPLHWATEPYGPDGRYGQYLTYLLVSHDLAVIDHMCDQFAIMLHGRIVEVLDRAAIPGNEATDPYARELIGASLDYDRAA